MASIAEQDKTLALTGLAHVSFLLPSRMQEHPSDWLYTDHLHAQAMKAYRARLRVHREQGKSYNEAQRLALVGNVQ
jgi:hypothetical protein